MTKNYDRLPFHMQDAARLYVEHGFSPGGFLCAVLSNNLVEAFARADHINRHSLANWAAWLYDDIPSKCWGSPEAVAAWIKQHEDARTAVSPSASPETIANKENLT